MKFTIDCAKWRCGGDDGVPERSRLGDGCTELLNPEGYMCCLGQVCRQLGVPDWRMKGVGDPSNVVQNKEDVVAVSGFAEWKEPPFTDWHNSDLSSKAIKINDNPVTPVTMKMEELTTLFAGHGHELEFINIPVTQNAE